MKLYNVNDLGYTLKDNIYKFRLWSNKAEEVNLCIYDDNNSKTNTKYKMIKTENDIFEVSISENIDSKYYTYELKYDKKTVESVDPYSKALSINGEKSAIINLKETDPKGFNDYISCNPKNPVDAIIYEVHIRDISIDKNSGIYHKGKFLGLAEENTVGPDGIKTGLSYIKELGVTHIQLLPIFDFNSIDEKNYSKAYEVENQNDYNWGYDPANYNVPEGSYSTNPYSPKTRIEELKKLIKVIHNNGLGVIMDVVYNHMYDVDNSAFNKTSPGYYFRYDSNGNLADESGCGNAIASENPIVRKYIVDSVKYWATEYKIDGFRFDLMGLLDVETMQEIRKELDKINPSIIIIGEGWNMGFTLKDQDKAIPQNASKLKGIGFFNDIIRDSIRGNAFIENDKGFVSGDSMKTLDVLKGIRGEFVEAEPSQIVNYVECHDNHTLFDKLKLTENNEDQVKYMQRLATSIVLLSQGIPFLHCGQEFLRTKQGVENSYNKNDSINKVDWTRVKDNIDTVNYVKGLIELRKKYPHFRLKSLEEIKTKLKVIRANEGDGVIIYTITGDNEDIIVIHNSNNYNVEINDFNYGVCDVLVNKNHSGVISIDKVYDGKVVVESISTMVLMMKK